MNVTKTETKRIERADGFVIERIDDVDRGESSPMHLLTSSD
jgi:hypothetical protein